MTARNTFTKFARARHRHGFPKCEGGVLASGGREGTPVETLHKAKNNYNMTLVKIRNPIS